MPARSMDNSEIESALNSIDFHPLDKGDIAKLEAEAACQAELERKLSAVNTAQKAIQELAAATATEKEKKKALDDARAELSDAQKAAQPILESAGKVRNKLKGTYKPEGWVGEEEDGTQRLTKRTPGRLFGFNNQYTIRKIAGKIEIQAEKSFSGELAFTKDGKICGLEYKDNVLVRVYSDDFTVFASMFTEAQLKECNRVRRAAAFLDEDEKSLAAIIGQASGDNEKNKILQRRMAGFAKDSEIGIPPGAKASDGKVICPMRFGRDCPGQISIDLNNIDKTFSKRIWLRDSDGNVGIIQFHEGKPVSFISPGKRCKALDPETQRLVDEAVEAHRHEEMDRAEAAKKAASPAAAVKAEPSPSAPAPGPTPAAPAPSVAAKAVGTETIGVHVPTTRAKSGRRAIVDRLCNNTYFGSQPSGTPSNTPIEMKPIGAEKS